MIKHNAALRCEQRYHETNHTTVNTKPNDDTKNAKRWESLLNALLCINFATSVSRVFDPIANQYSFEAVGLCR
ncbi:hypothetical protein [Vibrio vulnificus YJ016]|uniref:Uncharacterized protein n=1 Tax=Vibrio vulnificus (strain YJ016) TaxID=196600 RepID=Q7MKC8_VIBVY|nr:hypothetical protein [Vibrio vulnificus YJ016]